MNNVKMFYAFLHELSEKRAMIYELTKRDFRSAYLGSQLGIFWAFLLPLTNVLIFWFVFQIGFHSRPVANLPFILWYIPGFIIWSFFQDGVNKGMISVMQNSFIVRKVAFSIGMLPLVKLLSVAVIHLFFIALIMFMFLLYGQAPSIHLIQIPYYLFATFILVLGVSWLTSSIIIFFKDLGQIISILLQFGFFMTPVFWTPAIIPEKYLFFLQLNPMYYLVQGYRDAFINHIWFWQHPGHSLYFWSLTGFLFIAGAVVFRRLRPHFADVL